MSAPSRRLNLDGALGRQFDGRAVEMRAEDDAALLDLAQSGERHDLEAAGIGEDRMRPAHEPVQAAERRDALGAGPQHQVIGVAEQDVGAGRAHRLRLEPLTVAWVPTGMNAGVRTGPCGVSVRRCAPRRRWQSVGRKTPLVPPI